MTAHTPGPWVADGQTVYKDEGNHTQWCGVATTTGFSAPEARANARLIAAAPEMADILRTLAHKNWTVHEVRNLSIHARALLARIDGDAGAPGGTT